MPRILLVDDDVSFRTLVRILLIQQGHEVFEAHDGREALQMAEQVNADAAMIDMLMPGQDGLETLHALRNRGSGLPIIAMSGGGHIAATAYLQLAQRLGARRTLTKPFSAHELAAALDGVLAGSAGTQAAIPNSP